MSLALIFSIKFIEELILDSRLNWIQSLSILLIFSKHIQKEIHLGQINILLLFLLIATIYYIEKSSFKSYLAFVFSLFIKPVGIILIPFLIRLHQ